MAERGIPPAPPSSVNIFGARLGINPKRDATAVLGGPAAGNFLSEKYMRGLGGERQRLLSKNTPVTAPKPNETAYPGLFNEMGFHTGTPGNPDDPKRVVPGTSYNTEKKTNTVVPQLRVLFAPLGTSLSDLPGRNEIAMLKKTRISNAIQIATSRTDATSQRLESLVAMEGNKNVNINTHPMLGYHPIALAQYLHEQLIALAQKDLQRYRTLTTREIWQGVPDLAWTGWTVDGVVQLEQDGGRHSTADGDQYSSGLRANGMSRPAYKSETKIVTVAQCGQQDCVDVFGSRGVQEGASLFCIFKKYATTGDQGVTYVRSRKGRTLEMAGENATKTVPAAYLNFNNASGKTTKKKIHPPGFFFVAEPSGGELDPTFALYTDEWDEEQMGIVFPLGRVMFLPPHFKQVLPPIEDPGSQHLKPLTDATQILVRDALTIILPTHHDGHLGLY